MKRCQAHARIGHPIPAEFQVVVKRGGVLPEQPWWLDFHETDIAQQRLDPDLRFLHRL